MIHLMGFCSDPVNPVILSKEKNLGPDKTIKRIKMSLDLVQQKYPDNLVNPVRIKRAL
jgi:hypothetical protein